MTETSDPTQSQDPRIEALQGAYDRVSSYEGTAPPEQLRAELDGAIDQVGVQVDDEARQRLADHIHRGAGREDVADIIG